MEDANGTASKSDGCGSRREAPPECCHEITHTTWAPFQPSPDPAIRVCAMIVRPQSHPHATLKPPTSHLHGSSEPPTSHLHATLMRPSCDPHATLMRPSCDPHATI